MICEYIIGLQQSMILINNNVLMLYDFVYKIIAIFHYRNVCINVLTLYAMCMKCYIVYYNINVWIMY